MKICQIGPGIMNIPPDNWGAVESLIWDQCEYLRKLGHECYFTNTKDLTLVANTLNSSDFDFIHLQYDDFAGPLSRMLKKPFCTTTHYGYIKERFPHYSDGWRAVYDGVKTSPGMIALSEDIKNLFVNDGYTGFVEVLRNGARTNEFRFTTTPNKYGLCLGKIENRKRQSYLSNLCHGHCSIDFVGPIIDHSFKENTTCKYAGVWTKPNLYNNMTDYRCLVLLSDGEAAPLVVTEALSAGLSLVISKTAAANLDLSLPFVKVIDKQKDEEIVDIISETIENNEKYRIDIRKYAESTFDWSVVCKEYIDIAKKFVEYSKK